jgi:hypothetical protein
MANGWNAMSRTTRMQSTTSRQETASVESLSCGLHTGIKPLVVGGSDSKPTAQSALPCAVTTAGGALDIVGRSRQCLEFPGGSGMVRASAEVTSGVSLASIPQRTFAVESPKK